MSALDIFNYNGQRVDAPGNRLYAIEMGDMVKVGRSSSIDHRLRTHSATAQAFSAKVGRAWVGDDGSAFAEIALIQACSEIADPRSREYFPIPLERVIGIAVSLDWTALQAESDARAADAAAFIEALKVGIGGPETDPSAVAQSLVETWRDFDVEGYKNFLGTKTNWQHVSLILAQQVVGHSSEVLMEQFEIERLREMWEVK